MYIGGLLARLYGWRQRRELRYTVDSGRRSSIDVRITRHPGYAVSQRTEYAFGLTKTIAGLRKTRHRGVPKVDWQFTLAMPAYNLIRLLKLMGSIPPAKADFRHEGESGFRPYRCS